MQRAGSDSHHLVLGIARPSPTTHSSTCATLPHPPPTRSYYNPLASASSAGAGGLVKLHAVAMDSGTWPMDGGGVATCREQVGWREQDVRAGLVEWCRGAGRNKAPARPESYTRVCPAPCSRLPTSFSPGPRPLIPPPLTPMRLPPAWQVCQGADDVSWHAEAEVGNDCKQVGRRVGSRGVG